MLHYFPSLIYFLFLESLDKNMLSQNKLQRALHNYTNAQNENYFV
jgi:hypothetical protein